MCRVYILIFNFSGQVPFFQNFLPQQHLVMTIHTRTHTLGKFASLFTTTQPTNHIYFQCTQFIRMGLNTLENVNVSQDSQNFKLFSKPGTWFWGKLINGYLSKINVSNSFKTLPMSDPDFSVTWFETKMN